MRRLYIHRYTGLLSVMTLAMTAKSLPLAADPLPPSVRMAFTDQYVIVDSAQAPASTVSHISQGRLRRRAALSATPQINNVSVRASSATVAAMSTAALRGVEASAAGAHSVAPPPMTQPRKSTDVN